MNFFVIQVTNVVSGKPETKRLFRPNIPAVPNQEKVFHVRVPHPNPAELVRSRPDWLSAQGMEIRTRNGNWYFDGDYGVYIFSIKMMDEWKEGFYSDWNPGLYMGETTSYRKDTT